VDGGRGLESNQPFRNVKKNVNFSHTMWVSNHWNCVVFFWVFLMWLVVACFPIQLR